MKSYDIYVMTVTANANAKVVEKDRLRIDLDQSEALLVVVKIINEIVIGTLFILTDICKFDRFEMAGQSA